MCYQFARMGLRLCARSAVLAEQVTSLRDFVKHNQGLALALRADPADANLTRAAETLIATRPTAVNLRWAVEDLLARLRPAAAAARAGLAYARAAEICDEDVAINRAIGGHGLGLIRAAWEQSGRAAPVNLLTHCNAGWLATVDWVTAL